MNLKIPFKRWNLLLLALTGLALPLIYLSGRHGAVTDPVPGPHAQKTRVVSISPSITEMVYALGCGDCLVGRSNYCDFPAAAHAVPSVGGIVNPSLEMIAALQPRYVLGTSTANRSFQESLAKLGIDYIQLPSQRLNDYDGCIRKLGQLLDCPAQADAELVRFHRLLDPFQQQAAAVPESARPAVYLEVWNRPLKTCGRNSFVSDLIECAGGINIGKSSGQDYWTCSDEWVITANPAVIICPSMGSKGPGEVAARTGWGVIAAVKAGRIHSGIEQSLIFRLGPRTPQGVAELHRLIAGPPEPSSANQQKVSP
jgi:iron complex transport system substrate-binding protein